MTHSNLRVEVRGTYILVSMRGTSLRAKFRKQEASWLAMDEYEEDTGALPLLGRPPMRRLVIQVGSEVATNCMRR